MKLTRLTLFQLPLTSHDTYYMADGKTCDSVTTTVIRIDADNGLSGWGEVCPIPHYLAAYAGGVAPAVEEMAPALLGHELTGPEAVTDQLEAHLPGHLYARSMVDIALWDLFGKAHDAPLHALLGGRRQETLPLYHSITCVDPDEMARMAKVAYQQGMRQFQAKLGVDADWQADAERLIKVREAVGSGPIVYGDWNCGSTRLQATRVGRAVAHLDIMLEQPCATIEDCAAVRASCGLPMKQDETAWDTASLLKAHEMDAMDAVALKLSKFGGLTALRRARDLCLHLGPQMCIECTWGSDIVTAAGLHLAAATPPARLLNTCDLSHYVHPRIDPNAPSRHEGRIAPPDGPGLGVTPDPDVIGAPIAVFE
ncbi:MAG: enolase C-terminal domain-like protein [Pseudomonadota bacterium]